MTRVGRALSGCLAILLPVCAAAAVNPRFVRTPFLPAGAHPAATFADLDADGDLDLLVGEQQGHVALIENQGTASAGVFAPPVIDPLGLADAGAEAVPYFVDIDADGDLDAFVGVLLGDVLFFANVGTPVAPAFAPPVGNPFGLVDVGANAAPTFADLDGDGDLDGVVGESVGDLYFFANTGTAAAPAFAAPVANPFGLQDTVFSASRVLPRFADVDGDGDLDALLQAGLGGLAYCENLGTPAAPSFAAPNFYTTGIVVGLSSGRWGGLALGDIDADGDLDAVTSDEDGNLELVSNAGGPSAPVYLSPERGPWGLVTGSGRPSLVDIDADGDLDLFSAYQGNVLYFANLGTSARPAFAAPVMNPFALAGGGARAAPGFADLDGDGDLDAFLGTSNGNTLYFANTGTAAAPSFASFVANPFGLVQVAGLVTSARSPAFADLDGDGDLDALISDTYGYTNLFSNTGTPTAPAFGAPVASPFGLARVPSAYPSLADLDDDGDVDALIGDEEGNTLFCENTGTPLAPAFAPPVTNAFGLGKADNNFAAPALADVDADGDVDVFVGNSFGGQDAFFFRNIGTPQAPRFPTRARNPFGLAGDSGGRSITDEQLAFADIDGDGDLDAFVGSDFGPVRFFANVGTPAAPVFAPSHANPFAYAYFDGLGAPSFADLDDDGDLDAFLWDGHYHETIFFQNIGTATAPEFAPWETLGALSGGAVWNTPQFADVDGDGDLDAFMDDAASGETLLFTNIGTSKVASFSSPVANPFGLTSLGTPFDGRGHLMPFDVDADGDIDLFVGRAFGDLDFFPNVGAPGAPAFTAPLHNPFGLTGVELSSAVTFADLDDDGDVDAFVGSDRGIYFFEGQTPASPADLHCPAAPVDCPISATNASLVVDEGAPGREKLIAKIRMPKGWQRQFGDPLKFGGTSYALCLYGTGTLAAEILVDRAGDLCAGSVCWQGDERKLGYEDGARAADGTRSLKITHGDDEDTIRWRAENRASRGQTSLPTGIVPALPAGAGSASTLQVFASDAGPCRSVELHARSTSPTRYRATAP